MSISVFRSDNSALVVFCLLTVSGCSGKPDAVPDANGPPTKKASSEAAESKSTGNVSGSEDGLISPLATDPISKTDSATNAKDAVSKNKTTGSRDDTKASSNAKAAKKPATPSAEQIAKWAVPDRPLLQLLACYDGFSDSVVQSMAISPDGKQFVLGGAKLTLWNVVDSSPLVDLLQKSKTEDMERPIRSIAISPNGNWLAAGDQKGQVRIWNLNDQTESTAFRAHDGHVTRIAFSPNSEMLATTSYSGEIRLWQSADGKKIKSLKMSDQEIVCLEFLSDNQLAAAGNEVAIWNLESGKKDTVLTTGHVIAPALGQSRDRQMLAFNDADSKMHFWDVQKSASIGTPLKGPTAHLIDFSHDGKMIAVSSNSSNIEIYDAASGQIVQVIDGCGGRIVAIEWLPKSNVLLVASERGQVRIWGSIETAKSIELQPIELPLVGPISSKERKSLTPAQSQRVIDIRSFPRLPGSVLLWGDVGYVAYNTTASQSEAELFYRYYLGKAGWKEATETDSMLPGMNFRKDECELTVSLTATDPTTSGFPGTLQVGLQLAGNYDVRWLPKISAIESKSTWDLFSSLSYRTKATLTDVEVALLKQFHDAGWTAYTRLNASGVEQVDSRSISMIQGASVLTVSIGYPADSKEELSVQTSISLSNKSLPIPADSGWIEYDASTDLLLVANTKMDLKQTTEFYDTEMAAAGWLAREAGRQLKDDKCYLPYLREQQDVLIRLVIRPEGGTRVIVGDAEHSSWQLQKPPTVDAVLEKKGIEAADFVLPKGAKAVQFDVDQQQIQFEMPDSTPPKLIEQFMKTLETLDWKRESAGLISDEYCFVTFLKSKTEIQIRVRAEAKKTSAVISGNGLLWTKPLPTPPVCISYETWLRRGRKTATLDGLKEFTEEMHKISAGGDKK